MSLPTSADYAAIVTARLQDGTDTNPGLPANLVPLVLAQAQNESTNFTSNVFNNTGYGNAFGYNYSGSAYQTGSFEGFAVYGNNGVDDSAAEIVDYIYRRVADGSFPADLTTITTADQYATLLKNAGYYTASEATYASGISNWLQQNVVTPIVNNPEISIGVTLAILAVGSYFLFRKKK